MLRVHGEPYWDTARGCIELPVLHGLQVIETLLVQWTVCPACEEIEKGRMKTCSRCGASFLPKGQERSGSTAGSAEAELRAKYPECWTDPAATEDPE